MEDIIDQAAQSSEDEHESEEGGPEPPTKKQKKSKKDRGKRKRRETSGDIVPSKFLKDEDPRKVASLQFEEQELKKTELKMILLKHPNLDVSKQMQLATEINNMDAEQLNSYYEAAKLQVDLESPTHSAENLTILVGQILHGYTKDPGLYQRITNDTRLITAIDSILPSFGSRITIPLEIVARITKHIMDSKYNIDHVNATV